MQTPKSAANREGMMDDVAAKLQLQQFIDGWHFRILHSKLAKTWDRKKGLEVMLSVLELNGMKFEPGEKDKLLLADGEVLTDLLVTAMPDEMRMQLEYIASQLNMVVQETAKVTLALEALDEKLLKETFDVQEASPVIAHVMKNGVIHASSEVEKVRKCEASWKKNTEARMNRLMRSTEAAEHAMQQLIAVESQLAEFGSQQAGKAKSVLMNMASGSEKALLHSVFSNWVGCLMKIKAESVIRKKFEDEIAATEKKLFDLKERQLANVKGVLARAGADGDSALLGLCIKSWVAEVIARKKDGDNAAKMKEMEAKLAQQSQAQAANAKKVMTRMSSGSDGALSTLVFQAWIQFCEEYKKDREIEDAIKAQEKALKEHLEKKKDEAKQVLDRMAGESDSGLLSMMISYWSQAVSEEKQGRAMEERMNAENSRFKALQDRQIGSAKGVQNRVNEQANTILVMRSFAGWLFLSKTQRVERTFTTKMDNKRRQLQGVQTLFKTFAMQLEQGLSIDDGDSSSRKATGRATGRSGGLKPYKSKGHHGMSRDYPGSVSLPDIHSRPVVA